MSDIYYPSNEPPSISFSLAISPQVITQTPSDEDGNKSQIAVTATSHASSPITIFTFPTILNLKLSQRRHNFTCKDTATGEPVWMHLTKGPQRPGFSRTKGHYDDQYFVTLQPGVPYTATCDFKLACRPLWTGEQDGREKYTRYPTKSGEVTFLNWLESGHGYLFSVREEESIKWWWTGTREDVMGPEGTASALLPPSGAPISVKLDQGAVFKIS